MGAKRTAPSKRAAKGSLTDEDWKVRSFGAPNEGRAHAVQGPWADYDVAHTGRMTIKELEELQVVCSLLEALHHIGLTTCVCVLCCRSNTTQSAPNQRQTRRLPPLLLAEQVALLAVLCVCGRH